MGKELFNHVEILQRIDVCFDIDGRRLGPLEIRECTVDTIAGSELNVGPERWSGYQGGTPISTDVCGNNEILLVVSVFEDLG